ncbi:Tmn2p [Lachancea thermotolerans CBS 6340]|uniref:Transmembrane 9 superfamily member n=1 Tax=Lachancea thermotolerans (strain ATCC 56472 / CBS 6340 / NRRL Y-8284) TaxID=559295 RepID=C5DN38_LACTC|nr:KLTH0G13882p [Lachancea thermotolerans CBS 6340]CAR25199.1 KLTH0G13882p [Lachancea thermotolerans CBS 6340]
MVSAILLLSILWASQVSGFYLPGVAPTTYHEGDAIPLLVNHLTPTMYYQHADEDGNDLGDKESLLYSYDYYYPKFHFCRPEKLEKQRESLGSIIFGDRIYNSPFQIEMLKNKECASLCSESIPADDAKFINKLITNGFFQNWLVDGLPAARKTTDVRTKSEFYTPGFELGYVGIGGSELRMNGQGGSQDGDDSGSHGSTKEVSESDYLDAPPAKRSLAKRKQVSNTKELVKQLETPYFANHFEIEVQYHDRGNGNYRVVGVIVNPYSIKRESPDTCDKTGELLKLSETEATEVHFSYSVKFTPSETVWATRWDKYLHVYDPKIQWFSLINFSLVVVFLSTVMIHRLYVTLTDDLSRYNQINLDDDFQEETGWKLIHGDVFRTPERSLILSVLVGSGAQLFLMAACTIGFALLGLLSPSSRGSLTTVMFILYALFGSFGSYTSMATYKFFGGPYWKVNMLLTPILVPGLLFCVMLALNFFLVVVESAGAIPFGTMCVIVLLWFLFSIPLSVAGSLIARKKCKWDEHPTKTKQIPRQIPFQPWYLKTVPASLIAGIFPFGSIAVELYFIYSSLWFNKIFYMFGFLFVSFLLLTLTTSLITVLLTYYSLCLENWKWQWRGFWIGGAGCALYMFIHAILFTKFRLGGFTTIVLYVGYSLVMSLLSCLITGTVGFLSSLWFVRRIYSSVKVD